MRSTLYLQTRSNSLCQFQHNQGNNSFYLSSRKITSFTYITKATGITPARTITYVVRTSSLHSFVLYSLQAQGSRFGMKFRTPAEFVLHAKWLAFDAPRDGDTRLCACRYCSQNKQTVITKYLKDKRGSAASEPSHSRSVASRSTKRRRAGEPEKEISYKDYTLLFDAKRLEDDKHHLHQIKDEEL